MTAVRSNAGDPDSLRGRTLRWTFTDGPTAGKTYEHEFRTDGTLSFREIGAEKTGDASEPEPVRYGERRIADRIHVASYRSSSGFTLTVVLSFTDQTVVGFASNETSWFQQTGTFEVVA